MIITYTDGKVIYIGSSGEKTSDIVQIELTEIKINRDTTTGAK